MNPGDRYFRLLGVLLLCYAVIGKSVAYIGIPPLFVGEMVLLYGIYALMRQPEWSRALTSSLMLPLFLFMAWCAKCTIPYVGIYKADALRDAAVWGWGLFAIVTASLLTADPRRLRWLVDRYKTFVVLFFVISPITWYMTRKADDLRAPWADVALISVKGGDEVVHVAAILAYGVLVGGLQTLMVSLGTAFLLAGNFTGRASMMIFGIGTTLVTILKPRSPILLGVLGTFAIGLFIMWAGDLQLQVTEDIPRAISVDQYVKNVTSLFSDTDSQSLNGSKEWRLNWWNAIIGYTFHGKYFWTGKGFGVNLADDDGFQVNSDSSLRSPHNGHLTMLARAGVPGFLLWIVVQLSWAWVTLLNALKARREGRERWSGFFFFLIVYWAAFMTNAAFDVYLEGPLGGIWMWTVYGVGIGAGWIYAHCPEVLDEPLPDAIEDSSHQDHPAGAVHA